jgi:hypothetical protein
MLEEFRELGQQSGANPGDVSVRWKRRELLRALSWSGLDVVTKQQVLIAEVKLAVRNDGMGPGLFL